MACVHTQACLYMHIPVHACLYVHIPVHGGGGGGGSTFGVGNLWMKCMGSKVRLVSHWKGIVLN